MAVETVGVGERVASMWQQVVRIMESRRWQAAISTFFVVFILLAVWGYRKYYSPLADKSYVENREFVRGQRSHGVELIYFYTDWCPHCKTAQKVWEKFTGDPKIFKDGAYRGTDVMFRTVNCDKEPDLADKFDIKGYPTIKLIKGGQVIEYDAQPTVETLKQFLNTSIGEPGKQ